ncbi:MAG: RluA family pseudouridine synthase [Bacteroidetes bacterium]|nr:RluA family pseudouridine synthase [Bacteroidota bacterium]MCY4204781.1 RluA family pseudouridine synthase [Bacteroidota bacterium]
MTEENLLTAHMEQRLDVAMASMPNIGSRNQAQKIIRAGLVTVNQKSVLRPSHMVTPGAVIEWESPVMEPLELLPQALPIEVVYEDESLLVINKPANMPVHPGAGRSTGTLVNALLHHVGTELPHAPDEPFRPGIVHRLDMDTTGVLVVAKNDAAHRALQSQFEARSVAREYVGIVWGVPDPRSGIIDAPIGRSLRNRTLMSVRSDGRQAVTHFETHEILGPAALVRFQLETGRTHQIRVHLNHIGHPLLGDVAYGGATIKYGAATRNRRVFYSNIFEVLDRQALHARSLGFIHPESGVEMEFMSELPEDMIWAMEQLSKDPTYLWDS